MNAMLDLARKEGHRKKLPNVGANLLDPDVLQRRMAVKALIEQSDGLTSADIKEQHPDLSPNDIGWLRARGFVYSRRIGRKETEGGIVTKYHAGPKP